MQLRPVQWLTALLILLASPALAAGETCPQLAVDCGMGLRRAKPSELLPGILATGENRVPACVTPARLTEFLSRRQRERFGKPVRLEARFASVADAYAVLGGRLGVRWDLAYFQMMYETGHLSFTTWSNKRQRWSEATVRPEQMNFAGLGATIENPVGESFPSLEAGVLFHLKHLLAYSGRLQQPPTARRTCQVQAEIVACAKSLRRPVTFTDMTGMWAHNAILNQYAKTLRKLARAFAEEHECGADYPFVAGTAAADALDVSGARAAIAPPATNRSIQGERYPSRRHSTGKKPSSISSVPERR